MKDLLYKAVIRTMIKAVVAAALFIILHSPMSVYFPVAWASMTYGNAFVMCLLLGFAGDIIRYN